jgi:hypothetical protein
LEYLEDLTSQTPRVLLTYGDDPGSATRLRQAAGALAAGSADQEVTVAGLLGFESVDGCSLVAAVGSSNVGIDSLGANLNAFRCLLRPAAWENVAGLLEPFETRQAGHAHQYLDDNGPVLWIVSTDRAW